MKQVVIKSGAKQYLTSLGKIIKVEKLPASEGDILDFNDLLNGEKVQAKVVSQFKDKKVRVFKFKNKTNYKRLNGHRQQLTKLEIVRVGTAQTTEKSTDKPSAKDKSEVKKKVSAVAKVTTKTATSKKATSKPKSEDK